MSEMVLVSSLVALCEQASASSLLHSYLFPLHYVAIVLLVRGYPAGIVPATNSW